MDKKIEKFVIEKTNELMKAPSCCAEAKEIAQKWLDSVGTDKEANETKKYIKELEEDILPIDDLIAFCGSPVGEKVFGAKGAKEALAHGKEIKAKGAKYCDCPACAACQAILSKKKEMLG